MRLSMYHALNADGIFTSLLSQEIPMKMLKTNRLTDIFYKGR